MRPEWPGWETAEIEPTHKILKWIPGEFKRMVNILFFAGSTYYVLVSSTNIQVGSKCDGEFEFKPAEKSAITFLSLCMRAHIVIPVLAVCRMFVTWTSFSGSYESPVAYGDAASGLVTRRSLVLDRIPGIFIFGAACTCHRLKQWIHEFWLCLFFGKYHSSDCECTIFNLHVLFLICSHIFNLQVKFLVCSNIFNLHVWPFWATVLNCPHYQHNFLLRFRRLRNQLGILPCGFRSWNHRSSTSSDYLQRFRF